MKQRYHKITLTASLIVLCQAAGCSTTTELLNRYRLINSNPQENTQAARTHHRDQCMQKHGVESEKQMKAAIPDIQASFLYCVRSTDGWYLVEADHYKAELAKISM